MPALLLVAWLQAAGWSAAPVQTTVGDTIRLERFFPAPAGWRARPAKLEPQQYLEPLADPSVFRAPGGWVVRYPVVAWNFGPYRTPMPPVLLLAPGGQVDSLPGDTAIFTVESVLGDSAARASPRPALAPLRPEARNLLPAGAAILIALGLLAAGVGFRRRRPRKALPAPPVPVEPEVPAARWVGAGEPRAVAARAAGGLRAAIARAVPTAHPALSTAECLEAVAQARPDAPVRELTGVLTALDQVEFAAAHGADVGILVERARALGRRFGS